MTLDQARKVLLSQPDAVEGQHHGHPDFRVKNKIFATLWPKENRAVVRLPLEVAEKIAEENDERSKLCRALVAPDGSAST